jgi:hypothetical protein
MVAVAAAGLAVNPSFQISNLLTALGFVDNIVELSHERTRNTRNNTKHAKKLKNFACFVLFRVFRVLALASLNDHPQNPVGSANFKLPK